MTAHHRPRCPPQALDVRVVKPTGEQRLIRRGLLGLMLGLVGALNSEAQVCVCLCLCVHGCSPGGGARADTLMRTHTHTHTNIRPCLACP